MPAKLVQCQHGRSGAGWEGVAVNIRAMLTGLRRTLALNSTVYAGLCSSNFYSNSAQNPFAFIGECE